MSQQVVRAWATHLPGPPPRHVISLLGRKKSGASEYRYYDFRGALEPDDGQPTFQAYLDQLEAGQFVIYDFQTTDFEPVPREDLKRITTLARRLLSEGHTVILMDSGGAERVKAVGKALGYRRG